MTIQDTNGVLTAVNPSTTEDIFLALAKMKFSNTYIGGGFFTGANHNMGYFENDWDDRDRSGTLHTGLDDQTSITATGNFIYENEYGTGGIDTRMWYVDTEVNAPAIPLLIMADPSDLIGYSTVAAGIPGNSTSGTMAYSTGTITSVNSWGYSSTADVSGGMSGSGLYVEIDGNGDGNQEYYVVGSLARAYYGGTQVDELPGTEFGGGYYTDFTQHFYHQLAEDMQWVGVNPDDLPRYTLMSGFDENSSSHEVNGTYLNEMIMGGSWHDTLFGDGGDDIFFGGEGNDTFVFNDNDGNDIIRDFDVSEDILDLSGIHIQLFNVTENESGVLISYEFGESSILLEGASLSAISGIVSSTEYNVINIADYARETYSGDTMGDDLVYVGEYGSYIKAGTAGGNDVYVISPEISTSKLSYHLSDSAIIANLETHEVQKSGGDVDYWTGSIQHIQGSAYDGQFIGSSDSDVIWTYHGNDTVSAGGGDDKIVLHGGQKTVDGGEGYDTAILRSGSADMHIYSESDERHIDGMSTYENIEYIDAFKKSNDIYLGSGTGVEVLNANRGNDDLFIFADNVSLIGGSGSDSFHINPDNLFETYSVISIQDFNLEQDTLFINDEEILLDTAGSTLPENMLLSENTDGNLVIEYGDDDEIVFENLWADDFLIA